MVEQGGRDGRARDGEGSRREREREREREKDQAGRSGDADSRAKASHHGVSRYMSPYSSSIMQWLVLALLARIAGVVRCVYSGMD